MYVLEEHCIPYVVHYIVSRGRLWTQSGVHSIFKNTE